MRTRKDPKVRRTEILTLAARLFQKHGYANVQIEDVLKASGLSRGGFYHHFRTRKDLLASLIEAETEDLAQRAVMHPNGVFAGLLATGSTHAGAGPGILQTLSRPEDIADYLDLLERAHMRLLRPHLVAAITEGVSSGRYAPVKPEHAADLFLAVNALINRRALTGDWDAGHAASFAVTALSAIGALLGAKDEFLSLADSLNQTGQGGLH